MMHRCVLLQKSHGIYEDVNFNPHSSAPKYYHGVLNYTASATNALWAAKFLKQHKAGDQVQWGRAL
eukprot:SAG31_NODE_3519_length_4165_cov_2.486227_6_plen_66_part_00